MNANTDTMIIVCFSVALGSVVLLAIFRRVLPRLMKEQPRPARSGLAGAVSKVQSRIDSG